MRTSALSALLLVLCALAAALAVEAAVDKELLLVQVLHRHGARSGLPAYNQTLICTEAPCGYLMPGGILMLQKTGAFLRNRYNTDGTVVDKPFFPSKSYDVDVVSSRSTDLLRTLQSAESFLRGFFPDMATLYPAIHTQPEDFDMLLNSNVIPWLRYFYTYNKPLLFEVGNKPTDELYPDWTELTRIGATIFSEGKCSVYYTRSDCARYLFDYAAGKMAAGEIDQFPLLQKNYVKLQTIIRAVFDYEYHYDKSEDLHFRQGGRGHLFVEELATNMDDTIAGRQSFKLLHYSAHDTTLAPVWGTLGDRTDSGMLPLFAQVLVAELLRDVSDGSHHVRVLRGHPGQSPDTDFEFGWDDTWVFRCVNAAGTLYETANNTCPLDDFKRLVEWSRPADARGLCYLDADFERIRDCPNTTITVGDTGPTLSDTCQYYRSHCPEFACGNGCVLSSVSLQCVCKEFPTDTMEETSTTTTTTGLSPDAFRSSNKDGWVSGGAVAGIAIATFCVGAVIATAVTAILFLVRQRKGCAVASTET